MRIALSSTVLDSSIINICKLYIRASCAYKTSKEFGRTLTVVYATPIRKGKCRLFARFPFKFSSPIPAFFIKLSPRWYSHTNQNTVLEDDQVFQHHPPRPAAGVSTSMIVMGTISSISLIAVILWWRLGKLERKFYQGTEIPPRNK